jgi:cytochrome b
MQTMERIFQVIACLCAGAVLASLACVSLSTAGASSSWYYGVGLWLVDITAFRICFPTTGVPVARIAAAMRKDDDKDKRLPRPIR